MRVAFVHDEPLVRTSDGKYFSQSLPYPVWQRYLRVFDGLTALTRVQVQQPKSMAISSGPRVAFRPITSYRGPGDLFRRYKVVKEQISAGMDEVDCLIARLPSVLGTLACIEARKRGMPVLIELVGCAWDAYWHHGLRGKVLAPLAFLLTRRLVKSAHFVIYVTSGFLQRRYPCGGFTENISNVAIEIDETSLTNRLMRIPASPEDITVGSIGKVDLKYKGHHLVVAAMEILRERTGLNLKYEIVGGGNREALLRQARRKGLAGSVFPIGRMNAVEVNKWLDSIDLYIQPSLTEGLPRALIEAMSRGLPAIGSTAGGIPELLGADSLCKRGDASSVAMSLQTMLASDWSEHARRNHEVSREYSSDVLQRRRDRFLAAFLADALARSKSSSPIQQSVI